MRRIEFSQSTASASHAPAAQQHRRVPAGAVTRNNRDQVVGAIILHGGRILLGYRDPSRRWYPACWDVPGGHVEPDEHAWAALQRELGEEIGIEAELGDRDADFRLVGEDYDLQLWVVRTWRGTVTNCAPHEHAEMRWFSADQLPGLPLAEHRYRDVFTAAFAPAEPGPIATPNDKYR